MYSCVRDVRRYVYISFDAIGWYLLCVMCQNIMLFLILSFLAVTVFTVIVRNIFRENCVNVCRFEFDFVPVIAGSSVHTCDVELFAICCFWFSFIFLSPSLSLYLFFDCSFVRFSLRVFCFNLYKISYFAVRINVYSRMTTDMFVIMRKVYVETVKVWTSRIFHKTLTEMLNTVWYK